MITYRKTKQGQWVAYGPVAEVQAGADVQVATRAGDLVARHVESVGRPFSVDGAQMVYGYLTDAPRPPAARPAPRRNAWMGSYSCDECQWVEDAGDANGCRAHRGNPRN